MTIMKGQFLIAEPFMEDANFKRTVVLLCEHDEESADGLVLNQPSQFTLNQLILNKNLPDYPVFHGGPVRKEMLLFLHCFPDAPGSHPITEKLRWGGDFQWIQNKIKSIGYRPDLIRFFMGYSGWGSEQLKQELDEGAWFIHELKLRWIFGHSNPQTLWKDILKSKGGEFPWMANYPESPLFN